MKNTLNIHRALVVIDMQNDFITGSLGTKEAQKILPNVSKKLHLETVKGTDLFFTMDTHDINYLNTLEGKKLPVEHCIINTPGWAIHKDLANYISCAKDIIHKSTFGSFELADKLGEYNEVELIGLCTDICVISNAIIIKNKYPNITVSVDASCCAGVTPASHLAALQTMKMCQVDIIGEVK